MNFWVVAALVLWFGVGIWAAIAYWRAGKFDYSADGPLFVVVPLGVVDKAYLALLVVALGPLMPLGDALGALNEKTKPSCRRNP